LDRLRIALVVPALNEARTIAAVVSKAAVHAQVIVVNDGSTDDTGIIASSAGATVVAHTVNQGYDAALNTGLAAAERLGFDAVITLDADGQHDPQLVLRFVAQLEAGADVVLGVRDKRPRFAESLFALYTRMRYNIHDPLCGLKAYRMSVYRLRGHFDSYNSIGTELMLFGARNGYKLAQVSFQVREREDAPRFGRVISANWRIVRALVLSWVRK
jgi:glycosyltransferase involved in cell wall biosynthesis